MKGPQAEWKLSIPFQMDQKNKTKKQQHQSAKEEANLETDATVEKKNIQQQLNIADGLGSYMAIKSIAFQMLPCALCCNYKICSLSA